MSNRYSKTLHPERARAAESGEKLFFTGVSCPNGHIANRYTSSGRCVACAADTSRKQKTAESYRHYQKSEKAILWRINNAHRLAANAMRRVARRIRATPQWANEKAILAVYQKAKELTEATGTPHDVDHIIPLQGKFVCGLHVESNLRAIPSALNRKKSNSFE